MLTDEATRELLVQWADSEIFAREFDRNDFQRFDNFVGPGKGGANFDLGSAKIKVPLIMSGYTVRSVGPDRNRPKIIFIGKKRYQGILIGRDDLSRDLREVSGSPLHVEMQHGRLGIICYTE